MSSKDEDFLKTLRATFKLEADEHLQAMATGALELEKSPAYDVQRRLVETMFRAAHSLKGAARAVEATDIESLCQSLEDWFAGWKEQAIAPPRDAWDKVHRALDAISAALAIPGPSRDPARKSDQPSEPARVRDARTGTDLAPLQEAAAVPAIEDKGAAPDETVRIAVAKLDAQVLEAEEMLAAKVSTRQRAEDIRSLANRFVAWKREWTAVEPAARALRQATDRRPGGAARPSAPGLPRLLEFLEWNLDHLKSLEGSVAALAKTAQQDQQAVGKLVDDLLEHSKRLLLLPFATLAAPFPKLVRDLCRDQAKEADLVVRGEDVEIDKRVLEEMKAPLIHLLRNAVDHGVEAPDERQRLGKPSRATITLAASRVNGNKVELLVADDGAGIDVGKVKASAVEHGALSPEVAGQLGEAEARRLIFEADVSTSPMITRLSGRGLGLAIVREKAEKLGGTVSVESRSDQGTRFSIVLPSTLATFRGILVKAADRVFVVPTLQVVRVARVKAEEIHTVEGRATVPLSGRTVALVRLADLLELPPVASGGEPDASALVLVLGTDDHRIALQVDAVLDEHEVLVKPLRPPLTRVRNIAGATVLGSGQVAPILSVSDLLKSARKTGGAAVRAAASARPAAKSVLVAEDSITSRMLLKSILESAGYTVKTAVDGVEAFTLLRAERFDLVVSDVEMPRLDGFGLIARIRADPKLAELPVVLVTALETPADRERGIEVGASAYIVKSSFDQSNLLDAVRRLA
jgi:two-component system chemotaxis sensor kinase CheA